MRNPRELDIWDNEFFGACHTAKNIGEPSLYWMATVIATVIGFFFGMFLIGAPLDIIGGLGMGTGILIGGSIGVAMANVVPRMSKFYKGYDMPSSLGTSYRYYYNFEDRAKEYFSLSREDRRHYPKGIIEALRDPDLTHDQLYELDKKMSNIYEFIQTRNRERRRFAKRETDTTPLLEYMDDAKKSLNVEIQTYREFKD